MYLTRPATVLTTTDIDPLARATIPTAMSNTLQRASWDGTPVSLGTGFELYKPKGGRDLHAVCCLQTHRFGWEVVIEVNGLLSRSQVCRSRRGARPVRAVARGDGDRRLALMPNPKFLATVERSSGGHDRKKIADAAPN